VALPVSSGSWSFPARLMGQSGACLRSRGLSIDRLDGIDLDRRFQDVPPGVFLTVGTLPSLTPRDRGNAP